MPCSKRNATRLPNCSALPLGFTTCARSWYKYAGLS